MRIARTVREEYSEEVEVLWVVDVQEVVGAGMFESCPIYYPTLAANSTVGREEW